MRFNKMVFSSVCPGRLNDRQLSTVVHHISYSDWIFLYYLAKNMEPFVFCHLLGDLSEEFRRKYLDENQRLTVDEQNEGKSTQETNSIDEEVVLRKKNWTH